MVWPAVVGAGVAAGGDIGGAFLQHGFDKKLMRKQFKYNRRTIKESPTWQMEGYRRAGLNPILAIRQPSPVGFSARGGAPSVTPGSSGVQGASAAMQMRLVREQLKNVQQDTWLKKARTSHENNLALKAFFEGATASENVHTAKAQARLRQVEARIAEKYGIGALARTGGAVGEWTQGMWRRFIDQLEKPATAKSVGEAQDALRSLRRWFERNMPEDVRRRGFQ